MLVECVRRHCYCREEKYYPFDDPRGFAHHIEGKENAPDLLRMLLILAVGERHDLAVEQHLGS